MSIQNLHVEFSANTTPFEQGVTRVLGQLRGFVSGSNQATQATNRTDSAFGQAAQAANLYRDAQGRLRNEQGRFVNENRRFNGSILDSVGGLGKFVIGSYSAGRALAILKQGLGIVTDMQRLDNALNAVSTSSTDFAETQLFVRSTADRLGLSYEALASSYKGLKAASTGTSLEGRAIERVFTSVAKASAALQLSSEDTKGSLLALQQMLSKGTVSAEELRGQLGERIPGAFKLFAQGLNVSEAKLNKMLEQGEVLADVALPKFADALERAYGASAQNNVTTMAGGFQRLTDQVNLLISDFAKTAGIDSFFAKLANGLADTTRGLRQLVADGSFIAFMGLARGDASALLATIGAAKAKDNVVAQNMAFKSASPERRKELIGVQEAIVKNSYRDYNALLQRDAQTGVQSKELLKAARGLTAEYKKRQELSAINQKLLAEEAKNAEIAKKRQGELNDLKTKKGKEVKILDISPEAIYKRQIDQIRKGQVNITRTDEKGNTVNRNDEVIANLEQRIKELNREGTPLNLKLPERLDRNGRLVDTLQTIARPSAPREQEIAQMRTSLRSTGYDPVKQAREYSLAVGEITRTMRPEQLQSAIDTFNDVLGTGLDVDTAKNRVLEMQGIFRDIPDGFSSVKAMLSEQLVGYDPFSGLPDKVLESAKVLAEAFKVAKENAKSGASDVLVGIGEAIGSGKNPLKSALKGIMGLIGDYLANVGKGLLLASGFLTTFFLTAPAGLRMAAQGGAMLLGAGIIKGLANSIPAMAEGGLLTGPRVVLAGEAGDEAILPIKKLSPLMADAMKGLMPDINGLSGGRQSPQIREAYQSIPVPVPAKSPAASFGNGVRYIELRVQNGELRGALDLADQSYRDRNG